MSTIQPADPLQHVIHDKQPKDCILNHEPEEVVDLALEILQGAGITFIVEWHSLLYRRMNVPVVIRVSPMSGEILGPDRIFTVYNRISHIWSPMNHCRLPRLFFPR